MKLGPVDYVGVANHYLTIVSRDIQFCYNGSDISLKRPRVEIHPLPKRLLVIITAHSEIYEFDLHPIEVSSWFKTTDLYLTRGIVCIVLNDYDLSRDEYFILGTKIADNLEYFNANNHR